MQVADQLLSLSVETLKLQVNETVLTVTIHRPEVLNALSPQVVFELRQVFSVLRSEVGVTDESNVPDWSVRGVVLTGAGSKSFVAGADIAVMQAMSSDEAATYSLEAQELTSWIETLPVPVIAAVNGYALGGGCELAMACDYIFASENASFGQPEVGLGLIPGFGGCVRLQQYVGVAAARELIFTGRRVDAQEAEQLGLVRHVFPDTGALREGAHASLRLILRQSPVAVAAAKRTIRSTQALSTAPALLIEAKAFAECFNTSDMQEGTTAFVEKRAPVFPGT